MKQPKHGDLKVWHIPQIPGKAFEMPVSSLEEAALLLESLAKYDLFQYENNIKPDYSNANGLSIFDTTDTEDSPVGSWVSWEDEETGIDDPQSYINTMDALERGIASQEA